MGNTVMGKKRLQLIFLVMIILPVVLAGCKDEEKDKAVAEEAEKTRVELLRAKAKLAKAEIEIADLNEAFEILKQERDELASQVRELSSDRGNAVASSQQAQETVRSLSVRSSEQDANTATLQGRIKDLTILIETQERTIEEQSATIDDLLKTIELLQSSSEDHQGQSDANDLN